MVGGDQQALGVELDGMRLLGTPQARAGSPMTRRDLPL
jgi:hypothetical protein